VCGVLPRTLKAWRPEEDLILRDNYFDTQKPDLMEMLPGRSWQGIRDRASRLKIRRDLTLVQRRAKNPKRDAVKIANERKVLQYIIAYHGKHHMGPMRQQIAEDVGITRKSIYHIVDRLEARGLIVLPSSARIRPIALSPGLRRRLELRERDAA
jgi:biotin operon repressor